jgi:hypothetical protein
MAAKKIGYVDFSASVEKEAEERGLAQSPCGRFWVARTQKQYQWARLHGLRVCLSRPKPRRR